MSKNLKKDMHPAKELHGAEAKTYADNHLQKVEANPETWEVEYVDPATEQRWIMDFPHGAYHGGGPPRLRPVPSVNEDHPQQEKASDMAAQ